MPYKVNPTTGQLDYYEVSEGGGGGVATNLSFIPSPTTGTVTSDSGTDADIPLSTLVNSGLFSPEEKLRLQKALIDDVIFRGLYDSEAFYATGDVVEHFEVLYQRTSSPNEAGIMPPSPEWGFFDPLLGADAFDAWIRIALGNRLISQGINYQGDYNNGISYGYNQVVSIPVGSPYGLPGQLFIRVSNLGNPGYPPGTPSWELYDVYIGSPAFDSWIRSVLGTKVTVEIGKGLSTEDYTTAEQTKLAGISGTNTGDQSLQQVTDIGNTTTNDIQFGIGKGALLNNGSRLREGTIDAGFGGTKGIAQICAVGYELKWEAGRLYVMDGNGVLIRHSLYNFTTLPSATDDYSKGYYVGSLWTLDNGITYICTDSTLSAATWDIYEPTPQVNADWNATSGVAQILNKPSSIPTANVAHSVKYAVALTKGQAVYVSGADGTNMLVSKADYTTEATSSKTLGLVTASGAANYQGEVITEGLLTGLDTSTATAGDAVWLGANGNLIFWHFGGSTTKPVAPNHLVFIGIVTRVNANNGEIFVKPQNGFEIDELHDVSVVGRTDNSLLGYVSSTGLHVFKSIATWLGYTPANKAGETFTGNISATNLSGTNTGDQDLSGKVDKVTGSRLITSAESTLLGNTSGANTGDNAINTLYSGLATSKQDAITLTTTGTSGAATLVGSTLNVPQYSGGASVPQSITNASLIFYSNNC